MPDRAYEIAVALETLKTLHWKKTPGKDEIKATLPMQGDGSLISQAIMHIVMELTSGGRKAAAPEESSTSRIQNDQLTIGGKSMIDYLVNRCGVQFNGSDAYLSNARHR